MHANDLTEVVHHPFLESNRCLFISTLIQSEEMKGGLHEKDIYQQRRNNSDDKNRVYHSHRKSSTPLFQLACFGCYNCCAINKVMYCNKQSDVF